MLGEWSTKYVFGYSNAEMTMMVLVVRLQNEDCLLGWVVCTIHYCFYLLL